MATIQILSPAALGPSGAKPLTAPLGSLSDRVLGIRIDRAWRSFLIYADELRQQAPGRLGVRDVVLFDPHVRLGSPEAESEKIVTFARTVDAAVVGLGT
jgi:hypothetical protein